MCSFLVRDEGKAAQLFINTNVYKSWAAGGGSTAVC